MRPIHLCKSRYIPEILNFMKKTKASKFLDICV